MKLDYGFRIMVGDVPHSLAKRCGRYSTVEFLGLSFLLEFLKKSICRVKEGEENRNYYA